MSRAVYLGDLSVGRCFTIVKLPQEDESTSDESNEESGGGQIGGKVRQGMMMASADSTWKITGGNISDGFTAESAAGNTETFPANALVKEVPRQGFDRLVERARG